MLPSIAGLGCETIPQDKRISSPTFTFRFQCEICYWNGTLYRMHAFQLGQKHSIDFLYQMRKI